MGKLQLKFGQFSSKNFIEILTKFLRKFSKKFVEISRKLLGTNIANI